MTNHLKNIGQRIKRKAANFVLFELGGLSHMSLKTKRSKPLKSDEKVLIHFGCGIFNDHRYINVDARPGMHIDYVGTLENCHDIFPEHHADLIYCCHVIEHVSHPKIPEVLKNVYSVLKKGGIFRLSVPNFDSIIKIYQQTGCLEDILDPLMGGQGYPENFHYSVFNEHYLKRLLIAVGFKEIRTWLPGQAPYHDFDDWSKRPYRLRGESWEISLNLEAVK